MRKELLELFNEICKQEQAYLSKVLDDELTTKEVHLVICLNDFIKSNGFATIKDVADFLDITRPTAIKNINRLINKGYVYKNNVPNDKTENILLTYNGEFVIEEYNKFIEKTLENLVKTRSKEEITTIIDSLNDIKKYFK